MMLDVWQEKGALEGTVILAAVRLREKGAGGEAGSLPGEQESG